MAPAKPACLKRLREKFRWNRALLNCPMGCVLQRCLRRRRAVNGARWNTSLMQTRTTAHWNGLCNRLKWMTITQLWPGFTTNSTTSRATAFATGLSSYFRARLQYRFIRSAGKRYSGGWRVRLNLAAALMCPSDLLMLDEPLFIWIWRRRSGWSSGCLPRNSVVISHDRSFLDTVIEQVSASRETDWLRTRVTTVLSKNSKRSAWPFSKPCMKTAAPSSRN